VTRSGEKVAALNHRLDQSELMRNTRRRRPCDETVLSRRRRRVGGVNTIRKLFDYVNFDRYC